MGHVEPIQSIFSLPGGNGRYLGAVYEFLGWLEPRVATSREDAFGWFRDRFNAIKSAPYYLPVLRDFGVIEVERGRDGAIRLTGMGRDVLHSEKSAGTRIIAEWFMTHFVASREMLELFATAGRPLGLDEVHRTPGPRFPSWTTPTQFDFRLSWFQSLGLLKPVKGRVFEITDIGRELAAKYPPMPPYRMLASRWSESDRISPGARSSLWLTNSARLRQIRQSRRDSRRPLPEPSKG